ALLRRRLGVAALADHGRAVRRDVARVGLLDLAVGLGRRGLSDPVEVGLLGLALALLVLTRARRHRAPPWSRPGLPQAPCRRGARMCADPDAQESPSMVQIGEQLSDLSDRKLAWVAQLGVEHVVANTTKDTGIVNEDGSWNVQPIK